MLPSRYALAVFFSCTIPFVASPARAGDPKGDDDDTYASMEADTLFKQGVARMLKGDYEEGCPAIEHSYALDPRPGTLFTLGECEAQRGRLATGVRHLSRFVEVVDALPAANQARYEARKETAEKRCAELAPLVPKLVLRLPPDAPWTTEIKLDGELVELRTLGVPHPVDPGAHTLTVQVPGNKATEVRATVAKGETKTLPLVVDVAAKPCAPTEAMATRAGGGCAGCAVGGEDTPLGTLALVVLGAVAALFKARRNRAPLTRTLPV